MCKERQFKMIVGFRKNPVYYKFRILDPSKPSPFDRTQTSPIWCHLGSVLSSIPTFDFSLKGVPKAILCPPITLSKVDTLLFTFNLQTLV